MKPRFIKKSGVSRSRECLFFHTQLGLYAICLLASNFCISLAGVMNTIWVVRSGVKAGRICTVQAFLIEMGNVALAYFTGAIAVHTFNSLVLRNRQRVWLGYLVIAVGWMTAVAVAIIPLVLSHPLGPIYGPKTLTCGVARIYPRGQFLLEVLPLLIASILSAVVYSFIFLFIRGTLAFNGNGIKFRLDPTERWNGLIGTNEEYHQFIIQIARSMLWYPIAYFFLLLPLSITRMLDISMLKISFEANVFAYSCWFLMGLANVFLLYNTFRVIGPAFDRVSTFWARRLDNESFAASEKRLQDPPLIVEEFGPDDFPASPSTGCSFPAMVHPHMRPISIQSGSSSRQLLANHQTAEGIDSMQRLSELTEALSIPIPAPTHQQPRPLRQSPLQNAQTTVRTHKPMGLPQSPHPIERKPILERPPVPGPWWMDSSRTREHGTNRISFLNIERDPRPPLVPRPPSSISWATQTADETFRSSMTHPAVRESPTIHHTFNYPHDSISSIAYYL